MTIAAISTLGALVRRHDPDRFLTSLFAPPDRREALWTLYAFNHELARAREVASLPALALIRLQWWREVVEGAERRHEVASPLSRLLRDGVLDRDELLAMIAAREAEAEDSIATTAAFVAYLQGSAGMLAMAAGRLLGAPGLGRLRAIGTAYGLAGVLRSTDPLARQGRVLLPEEALAARGLSVFDVAAGHGGAALAAVQRDLAVLGQGWLEGAAVPRGARAAGLVGVLAREDLARPGTVRARGLADRLRVVWAGLVAGI